MKKELFFIKRINIIMKKALLLIVIMCCCSNVYANNYINNNYLASNSIIVNNENKSFELKDIAGYTSNEKLLDEINNHDVTKSMMSDLLNELKPYLTDVIDENIPNDYVFSTSDVVKIVVFHPIKFLSALKNYVVNSLSEVLSIAEENSDIVVK